MTWFFPTSGFQGPGPFFKGQDLILSGNDGPTFLRGCFVAYTGFHVRYCPEPPPFSLAQSGGDTTPAETTTPIRRVSAFVSRSSFLTDLVPGSHRVWSWKVHFLSQRPEIVVMVRCRYARRLTHVASCQSGCVVTRRVTSAQCSALCFCFTLYSARIPCRVQHAIPYAARGLLVSG